MWYVERFRSVKLRWLTLCNFKILKWKNGLLKWLFLYLKNFIITQVKTYNIVIIVLKLRLIRLKMEYRSYGSIYRDEEELIPLYPKLKKVYKGNKILGMTISTYFFCIYLLLYVIFICSAAALFSFFEAPEENALKVRLNEVIRNFLNLHPTVTGQ